MQEKLSTFRPKTVSMQELDLVLENILKERQVRRYFYEFYKFGILIIFDVDVKATIQYDKHILITSPCQKLKILHNFGQLTT
jgi:hypothetical protein